MDVIFCRNVLIYFSEEQAKKTVERLCERLAPSGLLILAPAEVSLAPPNFKMVRHPGVIVLQRDESYHPSFERTPVTTFQPWPQIVETPVAESAKIDKPLILPIEPSVAKRTKISEPRLSPSNQNNFAAAAPSEISFVVVAESDSIKRAMDLYNAAQYTECKRLLVDIVQAEPENVEAITLLARTKANVGDLNEALKWLDKAIEIDKVNPTVHYLRGVMLHSLGKNSEAIQSLQSALFLEPNFPIAELLLANLFAQSGKLKRASKHYSNCLAQFEKTDANQIIPESDGMSAGCLASVVQTLMQNVEADERKVVVSDEVRSSLRP